MKKAGRKREKGEGEAGISKKWEKWRVKSKREKKDGKAKSQKRKVKIEKRKVKIEKRKGESGREVKQEMK